MRLRFFSERVFGVWVDAYVSKITDTYVLLEANFYGVRWKERKPINTEFYYPWGHPQSGDAFFIQQK